MMMLVWFKRSVIESQLEVVQFASSLTPMSDHRVEGL